MADYARQYYHHVAAFPTYLSAVHARCDDQPTRKQLLDNLIDEEAGSPNHPELWLQFAEGLGVSKDDVQSSEKWNETSNLIGTFRSVCSEGTTAEGLAALYAYESQIPAVSESKIKGLVENYQMTEPRDYQYFSVHVEADREHAAAERAMLVSTSPMITPRRPLPPLTAFSTRFGKCFPAFAAVTPSRARDKTRKLSESVNFLPMRRASIVLLLSVLSFANVEGAKPMSSKELAEFLGPVSPKKIAVDEKRWI